jgi:hypothetical protein
VRSLPEQETGRTHSENGKFVPKTGNPFRKREAGVEGKAYRREQEKGGTARNPARGRPPGGSWGRGSRRRSGVARAPIAMGPGSAPPAFLD